MELPAMILKEMGYSVTVVDELNYQDMNIGISILGTQYRKSLYDYDVVIFQLVQKSWLAGVMERLTRAGVFTVLEVDDDYYNIPDTYQGYLAMHPAILSEKVETLEGIKYQRKRYYKQNANGEIKTKTKTYYDKRFGKVKIDRPEYLKVNNSRKVFKYALSVVSMVQVTTPELADLYKALAKNITVLPNCIDIQDYRWIPADKKHEVPVIGWYGAIARIDDLRIVQGAIPEGARLFVGGAEKEAREIFGDIDSIGFFKPSGIPEVVARCDIGIVPLQDYKFNQGKSDLKGLEFAAGFVPVVASDTGAYKRWVKPGINGYLAHNGKDWVKYLKLLVGDKALRLRVGLEAKKQALERDIRANIDRWIYAYNLTKDESCQKEVLGKV
jgi:glycosyltransferase involved in cell wall biosynthesis